MSTISHNFLWKLPSLIFDLYVRCTITSISCIIDIHYLQLRMSVLVMFFFSATRRIRTRYWTPTCTVPSKWPKYRRQDLGITYPKTPQRTEWTFPQNGCVFVHFQKMCVWSGSMWLPNLQHGCRAFICLLLNFGVMKYRIRFFQLNCLHFRDCVVIWYVFHISYHIPSGISSPSSLSHLALTYNVESVLESIKQPSRTATAFGIAWL